MIEEPSDLMLVLCVLTGCGGVIHADTGTFKSPNYPQNFPTNVECSWKIIAHEGSHVEVNFDSDFNIPDSSGTCENSYVKVLEHNLRDFQCQTGACVKYSVQFYLFCPTSQSISCHKLPQTQNTDTN